MGVEEEIVEFQKLDKQLQAIATQRIQFEAQLNEIKNAIKEIENSSAEEVYKLVGGVLIKTTRKEALEDLKKKKEVIERGIERFREEENKLKEKLERLTRKLEGLLKKGQGG